MSGEEWARKWLARSEKASREVEIERQKQERERIQALEDEEAKRKLNGILEAPLELIPASMESVADSRINQDTAKTPAKTIRVEKRCETWLTGLMRDDSRPSKARREYQKEAQESFPGLGVRAFARAWANAVATTQNQRWVKPGRKS